MGKLEKAQRRKQARIDPEARVNLMLDTGRTEYLRRTESFDQSETWRSSTNDNCHSMSIGSSSVISSSSSSSNDSDCDRRKQRHLRGKLFVTNIVNENTNTK